MSRLFQRLMELGEERSDAVTLSASLEINANATREELVAELTQLQTQLAEQKTKHDELFADAIALRSEYDTFRRTAGKEKQLLLEQQANDQRMLEELRRAGATGKMDEVYMMETEAKMEQLQAELQKAVEEAERAYKRQIEAERAQLAAETSKKEDLQELHQQFDRFKEAMRHRNEELEREICEARAAAVGIVEETSLEKEGASLAKDGVDGNSHDDIKIPGTTIKETSQMQGSLVAALQREKQARAELLAENGRNQRQLEDLKWKQMEAARKIAELKKEIDTWRSKVAHLEKTLNTRGEEHGLREKDFRLVIRQKEDNFARLERELQAVKQLAGEARQEVERGLLREQEMEVRNTVIVSEAESLKMTANAALEEQRVHFERLLQESEGLLEEQQGVCRTLEATLRQMREDKSNQADRIESLWLELDHAQQVIGEMELMQSQSQRLIELREEELLSKEEDRQKLRQLLREEEEAHECTRERMRELATQRSEAGVRSSRHMDVSEEAACRLATLEREGSLTETRLATQQTELQRRDQTIQQLQIQLDDLITQNARFALYREEQVAKTCQFEARIRELEAERSAAIIQRLQTENASAPERPQNSHSVVFESVSRITSAPTSEMLYATTSERTRQQFFSQAIMSARKLRLSAFARFRRLILASSACIVLVILASTFVAVFPNTQTLETGERAMESLRRQYTVASAALARCQAILSECRGQ
ncbi:hypothetical protein TcG_09565 [Trypanosoma cruzi]|uniref:Transmembrane protein n=1 Tax=Trypanosoma cruzi Dm28c TaxID=1416333 RepID=V5BG72_TRYCR|nr:hypothetical protein TCDM_06672 [Trypanosoma cruzi Dm28c]PBJ70689.1 hypothetical protein BCY84_18254 [Trypanosoma cruzi cruzi]RNF09117.1 hypothetical protein TcG_09565 [Trypanosoma cruzi]